MLSELARRLWTLGRVGWAARLVARARGQQDRSIARQALVARLGEARGLAMKAGQLAAALSAADDLRPLTTGVEPRPLEQMLPALGRHLDRPWREVFAEIEPEGRAASLGQVHRARLHNGAVVALKIRYPKIERAVAAELLLAGLVPGAGPVRRFGFDLGAYRRLLSETLSRELDYRSEALRQERFRLRTAVPGLVVPQIVPLASGPGLLVQSWEDGVHLTEAAGWPRVERVAIARTLLATFFVSLFANGEVHADPHEGNLLFRRVGARPEVVLLDFGCTLELAPSRCQALLKLVLALREGTELDLLPTLTAVGFDPDKLEALSPKLPALCALLFEPFLLERPLAASEWRLGARLDSLLGELRWSFRAAGHADLVLLMRAFFGLISHLERLGVALPWWSVLEATLGPEPLAAARAFAPPAAPREGRSSALARLLRVRITEGDQELIGLALPALEVLHLESSVPPPVRDQLRASGIDLAALVERVVAGGIAPQEVFLLDEGNRRYRVWLE